MKLILDLGDRKVYWTLTENVMALLAQNLVSSLGPAEGELAV